MQGTTRGRGCVGCMLHRRGCNASGILKLDGSRLFLSKCMFEAKQNSPKVAGRGKEGVWGGWLREAFRMSGT